MPSPEHTSIDETPPHGSAWSRVYCGRWLTGAGALYLLFALLFPANSCGPGDPKRSVAKNDAGQLVIALKQYHTEYGNVPGGGNAQILAALRGDNARKVVFYECKPDMVSARGQLLDPWRTPYRIDTTNPEFPWAYSFGKDRQDNGGAQGSDDIASWLN